MNQRPFTILGIQQIALAAQDKKQFHPLWLELFGLSIVNHFVSTKENVDEDICTIGQGPLKVEIDLMQSLDANKKPMLHTVPLNHIGLWVDDLASAVTWLSTRGVHFAPGGIRKGAAGYDICFIHPKGHANFPISGEGVLIELVQAPEEVITALTLKIQMHG